MSASISGTDARKLQTIQEQIQLMNVLKDMIDYWKLSCESDIAILDNMNTLFK